MNQLIFVLKREYWESKKMLVVVPLIVTALFFLMAMVATWTHHFSDSELKGSKSSTQPEVFIDGQKALDSSAIDETDAMPADGNQLNSEPKEEFWFSGVYLAAAWLAAMFYALSSLFNDRRDKSILYWKTMPVSELQTVVAKLVFAICGFSIVAIGVSWLSAVVLMSYAQLIFSPEMLANDVAGMSFAKLVIWPLIAVLVGILWCAPVFALLLYVSARAKKMPILLFLITAIVVRIVERIVFSSDYVFDFFAAHSPFAMISHFSEMQSAGEFMQNYLITSFPSLALGLLIAGLLIWRSAWHRDNNFEIQ